MSFNIQKWPELTAQEIFDYHTQIKQNKEVQLNWKSPGRIEPNEYEKLERNFLENDDLKQAEVAEKNEEEHNRLTDTQLNARFDVCQDFENENEKEDLNELFKLRTIQNKSNRTTEKKIACMDKIFSDMRRNFQQQLIQEQEQIKEEQQQVEERVEDSELIENNLEQTGNS
jgi:hypothetical protein